MAKNEAQRTSNKRLIVRMAKKVEGYSENTPLAELETNLEILEDYWVQFQTVQISIEAVTGPQDMDFQIIEMVDDENVYQSTKSKMRGFIYQYADQNNQQNQQGNPNQQQNQQVNNSRLPKFDGTYIAWTAFKDMFTSIKLA